MKIEFFAHSARLLRTLDHVLLWILSNNTGLDTVQDFLIKLGIKPCLQILKISNCGRLGPSKNICKYFELLHAFMGYLYHFIYFLFRRERSICEICWSTVDSPFDFQLSGAGKFKTFKMVTKAT